MQRICLAEGIWAGQEPYCEGTEYRISSIIGPGATIFQSTPMGVWNERNADYNNRILKISTFTA